MSLTRHAAVCADPDRDPRPSGPHILVGESTTHQWVVKDSRAALGAVFRDAEVALRFAQRQARALRCSVVVIRTGAVNLDCLD
jgi:hypothetical protein